VHPYLRLYRVADWLHFLPLPLAGWLADRAGGTALAAGTAAWALALAFTSAINQAFDDRIDHGAKNPVGRAFHRRRAVALSIAPAVGAIALLAIGSPRGLGPGVIMLVAAAVYSAPPRLKRVPVVGTVWNAVMGVPGFFFAGGLAAGRLPLGPLVGLFALLLLVSQLLHEAADRDDDAGQVRTIATEGGRRSAIAAALVLVLATPGLAWALAAGATHRGALSGACAAFALGWAAVLRRELGCDDRRRLRRLRLAYRYAAIGLGAVAFAALYL